MFPSEWQAYFNPTVCCVEEGADSPPAGDPPPAEPPAEPPASEPPAEPPLERPPDDDPSKAWETEKSKMQKDYDTLADQLREAKHQMSKMQIPQEVLQDPRKLLEAFGHNPMAVAAAALGHEPPPEEPEEELPKWAQELRKENEELRKWRQQQSEQEATATRERTITDWATSNAEAIPNLSPVLDMPEVLGFLGSQLKGYKDRTGEDMPLPRLMAMAEEESVRQAMRSIPRWMKAPTIRDEIFKAVDAFRAGGATPEPAAEPPAPGLRSKDTQQPEPEVDLRKMTRKQRMDYWVKKAERDAKAEELLIKKMRLKVDDEPAA